MRELLKFEFFFSGRGEFRAEHRSRAGRSSTPTPHSTAAPRTRAAGCSSARLRVAHLVLRPYLEAYWLVAHQLAALDDEEFDERALLAECLRVGPAVGAPAAAGQRGVGHPRAVPDRPGARPPPWPARLRRPHLAKRREVFADEFRGRVAALPPSPRWRGRSARDPGAEFRAGTRRARRSGRRRPRRGWSR